MFVQIFYKNIIIIYFHADPKHVPIFVEVNAQVIIYGILFECTVKMLPLIKRSKYLNFI